VCFVLKDLNFLLVSEAIDGALTTTLMVFFGYPLFFLFVHPVAFLAKIYSSKVGSTLGFTRRF